jgi:phosphatidylethanolamine/phosphatidyl-N-methylethanolamine N-methyltransferase
MDVESIKRVYGRHAGSYDTLFGLIARAGRRSAVETLNRRPGRRVLEVGVGTGLSLPLYRKDMRVVGIDLSAEMLDRARARVAREGLDQVEDLIEMDAEELAFPDHSFDAVVAMYTASVVPHPDRMLAEMRRVCVPGGDIVIVNHFLSKGGLLEPVERALAPLSRSLGWRPDFEIDSFLDPAELDVQEVRSVPPLKIFTIVRCRNAQPSQPGDLAYAEDDAAPAAARNSGPTPTGPHA